MEDKNNSIANSFNQFGIQSKYILRSTGEEVEVIDFYQAEKGSRSLSDWVSFIDSNGEEHVKESLSISFDFKASDTLAKAFENIFTPASIKIPNVWASRKYEIAKELYVDKGLTVDVSIKAADQFIEALKKEPEFIEDGDE